MRLSGGKGPSVPSPPHTHLSANHTPPLVPYTHIHALALASAYSATDHVVGDGPQVWQDLATWNVEFAQAYPEYPLQAINNLERAFLGCLRYELYISTSVYAKYYFALRALGEQADFRKRFMLTMAVAPSSRRIEQSTKELKAQLYSRSV